MRKTSAHQGLIPPKVLKPVVQFNSGLRALKPSMEASSGTRAWPPNHGPHPHHHHHHRFCHHHHHLCHHHHHHHAHPNHNHTHNFNTHYHYHPVPISSLPPAQYPEAVSSLTYHNDHFNKLDAQLHGENVAASSASATLISDEAQQDRLMELEEEEDDPVFVLTDEWREFFAKSEARRKLEKQQAKRKQKK